MLSIERITGNGQGEKPRYRLIDIGKSRATIAVVDGLERAGCLLRFLKGSLLKPEEYALAVEAMREIDRANATEKGGGDDGEEEQ